MQPTEKQHKKIMCTHPDRKPEDFQSQAIRFVETVPAGKPVVQGWLGEYFQVQIDHSAN